MMSSGGELFAEMLKQAERESGKYDTCMTLYVSEEGRFVELLLDTGCEHYHAEWIKGERGDASLLREDESGRVVGIMLPLRNPRLQISYDGPIKINEGFLRGGRKNGDG